MPVSLVSPIELAHQLAKGLATRADEADRVGRPPPEDVQALKQSGYLTLSIPREYGGQGLSLRECLAAHLVNPGCTVSLPALFTSLSAS
jgi:alkylation response protein AidB-like acyl-CoA dehydrogenase